MLAERHVLEDQLGRGLPQAQELLDPRRAADRPAVQPDLDVLRLGAQDHGARVGDELDRHIDVLSRRDLDGLLDGVVPAASGANRVTAREQRERLERVEPFASVDPQRCVRRVEDETDPADQLVSDLLEPIHRLLRREAAIGHPTGASHQDLPVALFRGSRSRRTRRGFANGGPSPPRVRRRSGPDS